MRKQGATGLLSLLVAMLVACGGTVRHAAIPATATPLRERLTFGDCMNRLEAAQEHEDAGRDVSSEQASFLASCSGIGAKDASRGTMGDCKSGLALQQLLEQLITQHEQVGKPATFLVIARGETDDGLEAAGC